MSDHVLIHVAELLAELADTPPCQDCTGRLGVAVFADGGWDVVQVHDVPCPATARTRT